MQILLNSDFFKSFKTIVFDCDGVVLDSNKVKTEAFRTIALRFGEEAAERLVLYHTQNGGISRQKKFEVLLRDILKLSDYAEQVQELSEDYGKEVFSGLLRCKIAEGLEALRELQPDQNWLIVSGGSQQEIRRIFSERHISQYFNAGIFGNPDSKDDIMHRLVSQKVINSPALFIGDSRYDHQMAAKYGLDFIFVSDWTEFKDYPAYCQDFNLKVANNLQCLVSG